MDDKNWKQIKALTDEYWGKTPPSSPKIDPIFAHASADPVALNIKAYMLADLVGFDAKYSYVATVVKKNERYTATQRAYMKDEYGYETPILREQRQFDDVSLVKNFIQEPFKIFQRGKHIKAMTFKNSPMTEEEFNDLIEIWRTAKIET